MLDLQNREFFHDPYPYYAKMRQCAEPLWLPHHQGTSSEGIWLLSRYDDGLKILKETAKISKNILSVKSPGTASPLDHQMMHSDDPDHLRLRYLVGHYFSAQAILRLEPAITEYADALLHGLSGRRDFDMVADFAMLLPIQVIAHLMGVPQNDMPQVANWTLTLSQGFDSLLSTPEKLKQQRETGLAYLTYIQTLIDAKRDKPDDSMISFLIAACGENRLDANEVMGMIGILLFAGFETTTNLIASGVWLLLSNKPQWDALRQNPDLAASAVEEIIRYESPVQRTSFRIAREAFEVGGRVFEPGDQIGLVIGSANRDESVFEHAEVFDIQRSPNPHLAFGHGLHNCIGKTLSRVEGKVALNRLVAHMPDLSLASERPNWKVNSFFRGLETLPVIRG